MNGATGSIHGWGFHGVRRWKSLATGEKRYFATLRRYLYEVRVLRKACRSARQAEAYGRRAAARYERLLGR